MKVVKTERDGWDCAPEICGVSQVVDNNRHLFYEINTCVRTMSPAQMIEQLKEFQRDLGEAIQECEYLQDTEFETVDYLEQKN